MMREEAPASVARRGVVGNEEASWASESRGQIRRGLGEGGGVRG